MTALALYFGLLTVFMRMRRVPLARFDFIVTATWTAAILIAALPLIEYPFGISSTTAWLVTLSHSGLLAGFYVLGGGRHRTTTRDLSEIRKSSRWLPGVAVVTVMAAFGRALSEGRRPVLDTFRQVGATRRDYLASGVTSRVDGLILMLHYLAIIYAVLLPLFVQQRRRRSVWLAVLTFLAIAEISFATGARASIVFTLVGITACYWMVYRPRLRHQVGIAVVGGLAVVLLGGTFVTTRNADFTTNPTFFTSRSCMGGGYTDWVADKDSERLEALATASCYFSSPVYRLDDFVRNQPWWEERMGTYNLGRIFQAQFADTREELADYYLSRRQGTNGWATGVRDMWIDFRELAPVGFFILGAAVAALTSMRKVRNEAQLARLAVLAPFGFMLPFMSPLVIPQLLYPVLGTLLFSVLTPPRRPPKPRPSHRRLQPITPVSSSSRHT